MPGASTSELDSFCADYIRSHEGAVPAFKDLYGFPGSVCISLNEEVVHGLPSSRRVLAERDIVSIDVGVRLAGWCSDSAWTFAVGEIDEETRKLLSVTEDSLERAIEAARVGQSRGRHRCGRGGRGTGNRARHRQGAGGTRRRSGGARRASGTQRRAGRLRSPSAGRLGAGHRADAVHRDGRGEDLGGRLDGGSTADASKSAHFEHTVAITVAGPRILTLAPVPTGGAGPVRV